MTRTPGIRTSRRAKFIAALLACTAHGAVAVALMQADPPVRMEGAAGAAEVALGSSFADMAAGTLAPEPSDTPITAEPVPPTTEPAPLPVQPEAVQPEAAEPVRPEHAQAASAPRPPAEQVEAPEAITLSAESDVVAAIAPEDTAPDLPEPPSPAEPITAEPEASPEAVAVSRRPAPRPETLDVPDPAPRQAEARPKPQPTPNTEPTARRDPAPQRQPQGNSDRNARAGQATGTQTARAASSGSGGTSSQAGNAAVSNYPGQVMRKLSRVPRPRLNARGSAVIAFRIGGGGGLAGLSVARSSGSAALDQAALRVVQRASPFPAPPSGARRSFSIEIKAR